MFFDSSIDIAKNLSDCIIMPAVVTAVWIFFTFFCVENIAGRRYLFLVQPNGDAPIPHAAAPQIENAANDRCGFLVNREPVVIVWVPPVPKRRDAGS